MARAKGLSCDYCGAPLPLLPAGGVVRCGYCERELFVEGDQARPTGAAGAFSLTDSLLRGYSGHDHGEGRRYGVVEMRARDWQCYEHGIWPVAGRASSQYGRSWSASAIVGAPAVYPRCGDIPGAWAPGTRESQTEWVEAVYPPGAPPARAIRVFETCMPGATYAVTIREGSQEELLWQRPAALTGNEAQVLELELSPPRQVAAVRAYVSNSLGSSWSEIDTIGLVATVPVSQSMRRRPSRVGRGGCAWLVLLLVVGGLVVAVGLAKWLSEKIDSDGGPAARAERTSLPEPAATVSGSQVICSVPSDQQLGELRTVWASGVMDYSTQYGDSGWSAQQALGAPDVYPQHGDIQQAWATKQPNRGTEWITVRFPERLEARAVVLVETFNPGALVRVDDVTDEARPVVLWKGKTQRAGSSRVIRLDLPEPRQTSAVRVVLDTSLGAGWNEIDAIGLVPR